MACAAVELWLALDRLAFSYNSEHERPFDQPPSLRAIATSSDGLHVSARATLAARLPIGYDPERLASVLTAVAETLCGEPAARTGDLREPGSSLEVVVSSPRLRCVLRFHGYEVANRAPSDSLARSYVDPERRGRARVCGPGSTLRGPGYRHQRHERRGAGLRLSDPRLRSRLLGARPHSGGARRARRSTACRSPVVAGALRRL